MSTSSQVVDEPVIECRLSWDPPARSGFLRKLFGARTGHDLDLIVSTHDQDGILLETAWHRQNIAHGDALRYSGDNRDGTEPGPDEHVSIDLAALPEECAVIAITVSSVGHGPQLLLGNVPASNLLILSADTLGTIDLTDAAPGHTTITPYLLSRANSGWLLESVSTENVPDEDPFVTVDRAVQAHLTGA